MRHKREHHDPDPALEPLGIVGDPAVANLLAARLRSEGIEVWLRGETSGPYPVGVGGLAEIQVFVDADRLDDARTIYETFIDDM
ncbi:MAG: DUF2007 domain-containing protein [Actinomycetota bacterium]